MMRSWLLILQSDSPTSHVWLKREQAILRESNKAIHWEHLSQSSRCMHTASHSSHHRVGTTFLKAEGSKHRKLFGIPWSFDSCKPVRQSSKLGYKQHLLIEIWFDLLHRYHIHGHITSQRDMFMVHLAAKETTVYNRFWQTKKREDTFIQIQWVKMRHVWCRHWWRGHTTTAGQIVGAF